MVEIAIRIGSDRFRAHLDPEGSPRTVQAVLDALPIRTVTKKWGDEFYFEIPVDMDEENAQPVVRKGDLGYWPEGSCFCIFFGKTPMSRTEDEIVPASPVNVIGHIEDPDRLKKLPGGLPVTIEAAE